MSTTKATFEPVFSDAEREELGHLGYLTVRLDELRRRGLIAPAAAATIAAESQARRQAIELSGCYRNAILRARKLAAKDPHDALEWAECARELDPRRDEAWNLIVTLNWELGDQDQAIARCALAAEYFPQFQPELTRLKKNKNKSADEERRQAEQARLAADVTGRLAQARPALESGRDDDAIASGRQSAPDQPARMAVREVAAPQPPISWSSFAGEFLKEHSQELLLCLAVLLIVVSSTVGAHLLLGDLLWSPMGKCTLAMVATLLFAAFGAGLLSWGANRAGRMMLVATLIVVPIHFMLVGEMKLLHQPSAARLAFLVTEGIVLIAMVRWVSGMLAQPAGARFLTAALLLLSVGSAASARDSPMAWEVQFASFQLSPLVFLGAVWALGARRWGNTNNEHREFVITMLGLLGFALAACLVRTGAYALHLDAELYGLPLMLIAISCVHTARALVDYEPDSERLALMRLGGIGLSLLAFALVMASPPFSSAVFSANTLAVAILGFGLYVASLRAERHPAYLYLAVGAVVAGRLAAHYFLAGRLHAIEEAVRQFLAFPDHLPTPFRAILGLLPNTALAGFSLWFVKHWNDRRLARHCHYIGVPLSIAACIWSGFEPLAASICLSGYAILYMLAVWIFAAPWVTYLAAAALAGACYFGTTLVHDITLADQALAAALLGFAFWAARVALRRRHAGPAYHVPWLQAALALTGAAMIAATVHLVSVGVGSWTGAGAFVVVATLAFLLTRERPSAFWAQLALLSIVEFTICGLGLAMGSRSLGSHTYGLLFMADGLTMLAAAELLRFWLNRSEPQTATAQTADVVNSRWVGTILAAIPRSVIVLTFVADWLGLLSMDRTWLAGLVLVLGLGPMLWVTRLVRQQSFVYLGLTHLAAGTLDLSSCAAGWNNPALLAGWLALTAAFLALVHWAAGMASRRVKLSEFYSEPCFRTAFALMVGAYVVALQARGLGREAYSLAAMALGLNVLVTMLLARSWRTAELSYVAVLHFVTATYLVLFSVGNNDPAMAYVLGVAAVVEAIVLWGIGLVCQRVRDMWINACARPLFHWAVLLTCLAVPLSDRSFVVLALVAVSFLLTVKSLPRIEWLYGAVAALAAACYFRWLSVLPRIELIACATLAAFGLWGLGIMIQRHKPALCRWLRLSPLAYEFPFFHSSIVVALIALVLRVDLSVGQPIAWTLYGWFPLALAGLSLAMLRAYPDRVCVHTSLAFLTWTVVAATVPSLTSVCFVCLAGLSIALGFVLIERIVRSHEPALCARLGVFGAGYATVVRGWALAVFGLAVGLAILVVIGEMSWAMLGHGPIAVTLTSIDWWAMLATFGLIGVFLMILGSDSDGWGALEPVQLAVALHWTGLALLWWLGVACSPLAGRLVGADVYYPLATAVAGLATARLVKRHTHDESWHELAWMGDLRSESMRQVLSIQAGLLAFIAVVFTNGSIEPATTFTLLVASLTMGLVALATGWQGPALAGSIAWSAAWGVTGLLVARRLGVGADGLGAISVAVGVQSAAFSLLTLAGRLRRGRSLLKRQRAGASDADLSHRLPLAGAMEIVAFASSLIAPIAVLGAGTNAASLGGGGTAVGVCVILAAALLHVLLVPRWRAEWLVYLAQAIMLSAYVDYRLAFPQTIAFDAIVLTLLGYLDLGIAEALERLHLNVYARPARFFSLVLPGLPLLQLIGTGGLDEVRLFYLLTAGTFYGIACGQLRWKSLGYASAVLYNAALWVLWSRLGWKLSTHPQFFLIPVGLSTILFAEVNRRELGRSNVNTIRTVGLTIIYLSLAVPIWQFESFGAWVTLLICSLVGVFLGIGLRLQTFLWMGLTSFVLDVIYEMGRVSLDYALAKWAIMLALGIALVMFVALNEKKRIVSTMRLFFDQARLWE
jgi:hypothetical protein